MLWKNRSEPSISAPQSDDARSSANLSHLCTSIKDCMAPFLSQAPSYSPLTLQSMLSYITYEWHYVWQINCEYLEGNRQIFKFSITVLLPAPKIKLNIAKERDTQRERERGKEKRRKRGKKKERRKSNFLKFLEETRCIIITSQNKTCRYPASHAQVVVGWGWGVPGPTPTDSD